MGPFKLECGLFIIDMNEYKLPEQCEKIVQRLYVFVDTKDIRQNIRLNLVVNPEIIKILINQVASEPSPVKLQLLKMISGLFAANSFNSLILAKRDREIMEFNHSILESLISLVFAIREYRSAQEMGNLVIPFIHSYPISSKIVKTILSITAKDFYYEKLDHRLLELALKVLQKIMKHQRFKEGEPNSYFITYGQEAGIRLISKSIKWPFSKGFHIYLKFYIQAYTEDDMVLFTLAVENDEFVVFVTPEGELKVKVFQQEAPLTIAVLPPQQWITMALSYTLKSKILKNYYEVHCAIDGEMHERVDLPVPKSVGMSDEIMELSLGRNFYGLIHNFFLSRSPILQWNKLVLNSWSDIEQFLVINKKQIRELFAFYHPLLTTCLNQKEIVYDITSQNHGQVFQNTGIYVNPFRTVDVNYYGGLYTFLPFLHILKFYPVPPYPQALAHIFQLFSTFFENQFGNVQQQAVNCQFFSIASQLINQLDHRYITKEFVEVLHRLSDRLTNFLLKKDFLVGFLWKVNTRKVEDAQVIEGFLEIIEKYYIQFFQWSYGLFSIDDVFHYIIDNFEPTNPSECCFSHYARIENGETIDPQRFCLNFTARAKVIKTILKLIFINLTNFSSIHSITTQSMQILFGAYSPCLKLLLLQSLCEGVKASSSFYIREFNILNYMYLYLPQAHLPDELAVIFQILLSCLEQDEENQSLKKNVINRIAERLDKVYQKKCEEGKRFRSNSDRFAGIHLKNQQRNYSEQKVTTEKARRLQKKLHRGSPLQSHKGLYESVVKLCFYFDKTEQDSLLKSDEYVLILQPYFKLCCLAYRKNIINMIRNTVILAAHGKSILDNLTKFDRLYKLLLNEFVLKELEPDSPDYMPTEQTNYIIRNVYFVIDYMIMGIRNDWGHLYLYLLRLLGLMEEAKKDIQKRTNRAKEDIVFAMRATMSKFIMRVIKLAEKDVHNLTNLVFLVYLTIFSNNNNEPAPEQHSLFSYYRPLQQNLFIGSYHIQGSDMIAPRENIAFVDSKLILETAASFRFYTIDLRKSPSVKVISFINSYLDVEYTNEESELYKNRFAFLVSAEFKLLKPSQGALRNILSGFLGDQSNQNVTTGQIFSVMLGLCVQSAITTRSTSQLHESLRQLQTFAVQFLLLCTRDGRKHSQHSQRNTELPKSIILSVLHFLYVMRENVAENEFRAPLEDSIYLIFSFLSMLIYRLYDKLGQPDSLERCLELSTIEKQVEEYNFFTLEIVLGILSLKEVVRLFNTEKEKALHLLLSERMVQYFRNVPRITIEKKVEQATKIHKQNVMNIKKEFSQVFSNGFIPKPISSEYLLDPQQFQKIFVLEYLKGKNLSYRRTQRIWRKIWKRLRVYHYFWSVGMNQRETMQLQFRKNYSPPFRHKFSKFVDSNGVRSILQIEPVEPWHVKKVLMEKEFEYRSSNYLYNMHHEQKQTRELSILQKLLTKSKEKDSVFFVDWIKNNSKRKGYLSIEQEKLRFKYISTFQKDSHLEFTSFILAEHKPIEKYWPLVEIVGVLERRYLTLRQCLLIQFQDSTSLIFNFINNDKDDFLRLLQAKQGEKSDKMALLKLNKVVFYTQKFNYSSASAVQEACSQWRNSKLSSFKYLNLINKYAGRSHLDPANFPVFPWIIASYDNFPYKFRDLSKTIGGLGNEQLTKHYRSKTETIDPFDPVPAYQYGTHYSSPGMVFNFLIRLQPYTEASRTLQGGKFDLSDRLFSSIRICWHSVITEISDVRELVPEFYYLPEFLLNIQQHNFGLTQMKERVHNVHLPGWSSNAYEFITRHRLEFEGSKVSEHLNEWIDLIFGYKQKGKIAQENLNLFYYLTYENSIDLKQIEDPQIKVSKEAQIMHFGQTPSQLFFKPHPTRQKGNHRVLRNFKKVRLLFCLQGSGEVSLLYQRDGRLGVFHEYSVKVFNELGNCSLHSQVKLLRNNSKESIYFIEDIDCTQRTALFGNGQFMAIASYINGDLAIFSLATGKKIEQKKGAPRNCIFVNAQQNLLFSGGKNGLLQVFQILYGQKETVTLIKIAFQYYQSPIYSISQGGNFYAVASGSLVAIIKISRSLTYAHDKIKMRGIKMIRSFQANRNVDGAILSPDPLFSVVFYNSLEICSYSINGQLLKTKQTQVVLPPQKIRGDNFTDLLASVQGNKLLIYSMPFLDVISSIKLPNKTFREMRFFDDRCYLTTNQGEILCLSDLEQDHAE